MCIIVFIFRCRCLIWFWSVCYLWTCIYCCHKLLPHCLVFSGDVQTLTLLDGGIIRRLGLVREQGHRVGLVFLQTQGLWNDLAAPFSYHSNYNCITLKHTAGNRGWGINIPTLSPLVNGNREWTGPQGTWISPTIGPNLVQTQPNLMWVNNKKRKRDIFFFQAGF